MGIGCTVNKAISPRGSEEDGLIPGFMAYSRRLAARLRDEGGMTLPVSWICMSGASSHSLAKANCRSMT